MQIRKPGVEAEDLRGERLRLERAEHAFQRAFHGAIAEHGLGLAGQQQVLHQVEDEQRRHAEIGKALPHLGREQDRQALRMAEQVACAGAAWRFCRRCRCMSAGGAPVFRRRITGYNRRAHKKPNEEATCPPRHPVRRSPPRPPDGRSRHRRAARDLEAQCAVSARRAPLVLLRLHGCDGPQPLSADHGLSEGQARQGRLFRPPAGELPDSR